jgi:Rieske Fe-S protein
MARDDAGQAAPGSKPEMRAVERDYVYKNERCCQGNRPDWRRRALIGGLTGWIFSPMLFRSSPARAADGGGDPTKMRAQAGDQLVFKTGARKGEAITIADMAYGAKQLFAYPYEPVDGVLRRGSRLNQILVLRLAEDGYTDKVRARAVNGVIAYSAICTHENCPVSGWLPDDQLFICPCHESIYDPKDGARVVSGPARRALPALPLTVMDGVLMAAGGLTGRVGRPKRT